MRDAWINGDSLLRGLRGTVVTVPISGTFARPRIDRRGFRQMTARMVQGALQKTLSDELSKQLEKLLSPK